MRIISAIIRDHDYWTPRLLFTYFLLKLATLFYYHLSSYSYVDLTEDKWLVVEPKSEPLKDKPNCPIIPKFDIEDWRAFRQQTRYETFFPEDDDDDDSEVDVGMTNLRQKLNEKGFRHESSWTPSLCNAVHNVTLIVPYRNRFRQLKKFVVHIHPFLKLQQVSYRIVIVEHKNGVFNKGKLFNIGFVESERRFPSHCYVFHDVDLLPENLENIYGCTKTPRHLSPAANSWRYLLSYSEVFGGVVSMTGNQFKQINGYSNSYIGWGAEDDDFYERVVAHNFSLTRFNPLISSYVMTPHKKEESGNNEKLFEAAGERFAVDGLSDLNYTLVSFEDGVGFTYIQAYV